MHAESLTLEYDQDDHLVWLVFSDHGAALERTSIWLRDGFGLGEVRDALLAVGWAVSKEQGELRLANGARRESIRDVVQEMLGYFDAPGVASRELIDIKSAVARCAASVDSLPELSWYAYAWLDVMVRNDIADEARGGRDIWTLGETVVDVVPHFRRRLKQLLSRLGQSVGETSVGEISVGEISAGETSGSEINAVRMAGSLSTRRASAGRDFKAG
ncbi:MAG: hypothetical protein RIC55_25640 [Pirellulaceae bacterium]